MLVLLAAAGVGGAPAGASTAPVPDTMSASPAAGPVGTVVQLHGRLSPGCASAGTIDIELDVYGQTRTGGFDAVTAAVAPDGSFAVLFRIPPDLGGAATRGLYAYTTSPGRYEFRVVAAGCPGSVVAAFWVTGPASPPPAAFVAMAPTASGRGYWLAQAGGGVYSFGGAPFLGSLPAIHVTPAAPISAMAVTPDGKGYWLAGADGGVYAFGDAGFHGSLPGIGVTPYGPIVAMASTPDGKGYWLLGADGGVFAFGDAQFSGPGTDWLSPFEAIGGTPSGGYDVVTSRPGQIWQYPGGQQIISLPDASTSFPQAASLSGAAITPDGNGGWQVGLEGGVFAFGDAGFYGSLPGIGVTPAAPVVGMARTPDGRGYWLLGADGGVFAFGDAGFHGSAAPAPELLGNGVAGVRFGQREVPTIAALDQLLGSPTKGPVDDTGDCTIDAAEQWTTLTAYFDAGRFVGYSTNSTVVVSGEPLAHQSLVTAQGMRVGDTVTQASAIYGAAFTTSLAQGGSWSVATPGGTLDGYLSGEPNQPGPPPTIASIEAGSVGCPAMSP